MVAGGIHRKTRPENNDRRRSQSPDRTRISQNSPPWGIKKLIVAGLLVKAGPGGMSVAGSELLVSPEMLSAPIINRVPLTVVSWPLAVKI